MRNCYLGKGSGGAACQTTSRKSPRDSTKVGITIIFEVKKTLQLNGPAVKHLPSPSVVIKLQFAVADGTRSNQLSHLLATAVIDGDAAIIVPHFPFVLVQGQQRQSNISPRQTRQASDVVATSNEQEYNRHGRL